MVRPINSPQFNRSTGAVITVVRGAGSTDGGDITAGKLVVTDGTTVSGKDAATTVITPTHATSTTVAVFPLDAHLPSRLRRKMDERCLIGNDVGSVGLVAAGGQGTDAPVVHAGACCRVGACVPRWPAGAGAA